MFVFAADVPGLPVLPGVARGDSIHQPAGLHVLQRLVHVSEHQLGGGNQPLPGPASVWYADFGPFALCTVMLNELPIINSYISNLQKNFVSLWLGLCRLCTTHFEFELNKEDWFSQFDAVYVRCCKRED